MGEWASFPEAEQLLPNAERAQRQRFPVLLIPKKQSPETSDWFVYWFVKTVMAPCQRRRGNRSANKRKAALKSEMECACLFALVGSFMIKMCGRLNYWQITYDSKSLNMSSIEFTMIYLQYWVMRASPILKRQQNTAKCLPRTKFAIWSKRTLNFAIFKSQKFPKNCTDPTSRETFC